MTFLRNILGLEPKTDYAALIRQGAIIVDVRTPAEYKSGHIKGSLNLPLDSLGKNLSKLKKDKFVICCCASGMRKWLCKEHFEIEWV